MPDKFIKVFELTRDDVDTIELVSDGYFSIPDEVSINSYEKMHEEVENKDPYKYKKYLSTKSKDDRTIAILRFKK